MPRLFRLTSWATFVCVAPLAAPCLAGSAGNLAAQAPTPSDASSPVTPPRVRLGNFLVHDIPPRQPRNGLEDGVVLKKLVVSGLERRGDVSVAVGGAAPANYLVSVRLARIGKAGRLSVSLTGVSSRTVLAARRFTPPGDADPVSLARVIVGQVVESLRGQGVLLAWQDPVPDAAPTAFRAAGISPEAVDAFIQGAAAEQAGDAKGAAAAYEKALELGGPEFVEAAEALDRTKG